MSPPYGAPSPIGFRQRRRLSAAHTAACPGPKGILSARAVAHARAAWPRFVAALASFIRWPAGHLRTSAVEHVRVAHKRRHPIVTADWRHAPGATTVLSYGQYDAQSPEPLTEWVSPPFASALRGSCLYGRGASDDKGQMFAHEGEEEGGAQPNPGIGNASEFASTAVYFRDWHKRVPSEAEWRQFTVAFPRRTGRKWTWIGDVPSLVPYRRNTFYLDDRARNLPPGAAHVLPPGAAGL